MKGGATETGGADGVGEVAGAAGTGWHFLTVITSLELQGPLGTVKVSNSCSHGPEKSYEAPP